MERVKLKVGKYLYPVGVVDLGNQLELQFGYNADLLAEIKVMQGARYHGFDKENPRKVWTVKKSPRNEFRLAFMQMQDVYAPYNIPLVDWSPTRQECYVHQRSMGQHVITRRQCIIAGEMGTGKTLTLIEVLEYLGIKNAWWVGPKSALWSVQREFRKWASKILPEFMSYEAMKSKVTNWVSGRKPPQIVVFDEASRLKNATSQRSQAGQYLADSIRAEYGNNGYITLMSGSPAPKSPVDWWNLCEIACPGFLREGNVRKFQERLAIIKSEENSVTGGVFPKIVAWKDDESKCAECGMLQDDPFHDISLGGHCWRPSKNEVKLLHQRMKGLITIFFKKDCLDLPEKRFELIRLKPSEETLRLARFLLAKAPSTIEGLTLVRELSDGFQYRAEKSGETMICPSCKGTKTQKTHTHPETNALIEIGNPIPLFDGAVGVWELDQNNQYWERIKDASGHTVSEKKFIPKETITACEICSGTGEINKEIRTVKEVTSPKEDALRELLDVYDDQGRVVIYAGFTGSVDKCVKVVQKQGWEYIRMDGRGCVSSMKGTPSELLDKFDDTKNYEKVAFIGHPQSGGMGLNLQVSQCIIYYSNDFNGESRIQSIERTSRAGNIATTIYDFIHLPTDELVLDNLNKKINLQGLTLGQMKLHLDEIKTTDWRVM